MPILIPVSQHSRTLHAADCKVGLTSSKGFFTRSRHTGGKGARLLDRSARLTSLYADAGGGGGWRQRRQGKDGKGGGSNEKAAVMATRLQQRGRREGSGGGEEKAVAVAVKRRQQRRHDDGNGGATGITCSPSSLSTLLLSSLKRFHPMLELVFKYILKKITRLTISISLFGLRPT